MFFKKKPQMIVLIANAAAANRMPGGRNVNGQYRFPQPLFDDRERSGGRQIGTHLDDGVDIITVHLFYDFHYLVIGHEGNRVMSVFATQAHHVLDVVA